MSTNYQAIAQAIRLVEQSKDSHVVDAYKRVNSALMGGESVADLAKGTGVHKTTMGYYALGGRAWFGAGMVHDVTAVDFRQELIKACKIAGVKTVRDSIDAEIATGAPRLGALVDLWATYEREQKEPKTDLEKVLALLPNLSTDELAVVWDTLATMATEQATELVNA